MKERLPSPAESDIDIISRLTKKVVSAIEYSKSKQQAIDGAKKVLEQNNIPFIEVMSWEDSEREDGQADKYTISVELPRSWPSGNMVGTWNLNISVPDRPYEPEIKDYP
jgi:hypothetical protein